MRTGVRGACGLGSASWTDAVLTAGVTVVKAAHLSEVRTAVVGARSACGGTAPVWTDAVLAATPIKAVHVTELRTAVELLEQGQVGRSR